MKKRLKFEMFILCVSLLFFALYWTDSKSTGQLKAASIQGCGGRLSQNMHQTLKTLNHDLRNVKRILVAKPHQILFINNENQIEDYSYAYQEIMYNNNAVASNIVDFHFEFRDRGGNLLTRCQRNLPDIVTVGYTIGIQKQKQIIYAYSKVSLSFLDDTAVSTIYPEMAFVQSSSQ